MASHRTARHMMDRPKLPKNVVEYPLCQVEDVQGACLVNAECRNQRGRFAGHCDDPELVCCVVESTCGAVVSSHSVTFVNPSYPKSDDQPTLCPLRVKLGKGVCAVRVFMNTLEMSFYEDDVCTQDTLTILGSTEGVASPICGNMTHFETTFAVKELSEVTLALVAQKKHRFSITVSQLDCKSIPTFISPTYAGIRNADAEIYIPTPSTESPRDSGESTTTEITTIASVRESDEAQTTEKSGDDSSAVEPPATQQPEISEENVNDKVIVTEADNLEPTTLKVGKYPSRTTTPAPRIVIGLPDEEYNNDDFIDKDGIYLEDMENLPVVSEFKKAFDFKVQDKCFQYEEEEPEPISFRVIGGYRTNLNEYPWQVALVYNKKFFCGGSLISDRHILTAAHCVFGSFKKGIDALYASLGDHDLSTRNETKNIAIRIKKVIWHLNYSPNSNINDIAIFELSTPVNFTYSISAVKLPQDTGDMFGGENATVTGWGRYSSSTKKTSPILKEYTAPVFNAEKCAKAWKSFPSVKAYADMHICLNITLGTPCHGDSGGPLVVCHEDSCSQVGVVSFGFPLCTNVGMPAVFTRVTNYRGWLNRNLAPLYTSQI